MNVLERKSDNDLIEAVMNCELDFDYRKHAAMEIMQRLGVNAPWIVKTANL